MMSKNVEPLNNKLTSDSKQKVEKLEQSVQNIEAQIHALQEEHEENRLQGSLEDAKAWLESMPIETLKESLERDYGLKPKKYTFKKFGHKFELERQLCKESVKLSNEQMALREAKVDYLLDVLRKIG